MVSPRSNRLTYGMSIPSISVSNYGSAFNLASHVRQS
jgi:hypothetical protein